MSPLRRGTSSWISIWSLSREKLLQTEKGSNYKRSTSSPRVGWRRLRPAFIPNFLEAQPSPPCWKRGTCSRMPQVVMPCSIRLISRSRPHVSPLCPSTPRRRTRTPSQMPSRNTWYWISRKLTAPSRSTRIHPCIIQREHSKRVFLKRMSSTLLKPRENGPRSGQRITEWPSLAYSQAERKAQALDRETMTRANRIGERSLILTTPT